LILTTTKLRRITRWIVPPRGPLLRLDPGDGRPIILFLKRGRFSFINPATHEFLIREFPECRVVPVDLFDDILPRHRAGVLGCWAEAVGSYGGDLISRKRVPFDCFQRTAGYVRTVRRIIRERFAPYRDRIRFTFQTQALFDGSIPGIPHFLYTDHSHLANLSYGGFDSGRLFRPDWIDEEREIFRAATLVFVMSGHVRRSLIDRYAIPEENVVTAYAGSNVERPAEAADPSRFSGKNILFVGVDWERKGGPDLLAAFRSIKRRFPDATLTVIGCSPAISESGVHIVGRIPPEAVRPYFGRASVFCLPSRIEPFGIAVVEAFAHGLPVVATRIGALSDMVEEGRSGHLVEPGSVDALGDALADLLQSPQRCAAFGERGRKQIADRYSWEAAGKRIGEAIRASVSNKPLPAL
jgi:glycosyltransferase involved in cell wall biosynthesis